MSETPPDSVGLDLTQHRPVRVRIDRHGHVAGGYGEGLLPPSVVLPAVRGEPLVAGKDADQHRRGVGITWPPEAHAPSPRLGSARVPLMAAWARLAASAAWGTSRDDPFYWVPRMEAGSDGDRPVRMEVAASEVIAASGQYWFNGSQADRTALVVPDSFSEDAQQAVLDRLSTFLIPRPVAVALNWCRTDATALMLANSARGEGSTVGWLAVVTTPMDSWEAVWIEIRRWESRAGRFLVPVHRRPDEGCELPWVGAAMLHALAGSSDHAEPWRELFDETRLQVRDGPNEAAMRRGWVSVRDCVHSGWDDRSRSELEPLDVWKDLLAAGQGFNSPEALRIGVAGVLRRSTPLNPSPNLLGVVIDGACTSFRLGPDTTVGSMLRLAAPSARAELGDGTYAGRGAAWAAEAVARQVPPYLEVIVPVELYCLRRDELGDLRGDWKRLVRTDIVPAGEEYAPDEPIRGLAMRPGEPRLDLTLRRRITSGAFAYRTATVDVRHPPATKEAVDVHVRLRPGQGYARVRVRSVTPGVFDGDVDWRRMQECAAPVETFGYIPGVSRVQWDAECWRAARSCVARVVAHAEDRRTDQLEQAIKRLLPHANKWPLRDREFQRRGLAMPAADLDPFLHVGMFPSDGNWSVNPDRKTAETLRTKLLACVQRLSGSDATREGARRLLGWMYAACPATLVAEAISNISEGRAIDLHTVGLCCRSKKQLAEFLRHTASRLSTTRVGVNNWLRALRDAVRFQEHCLSPDVVCRADVDRIMTAVLDVLAEEIEKGTPKMRFANCVNALPYLLKRRRYEVDFAAEGSPFFAKTDQLLTICLQPRSRLRLTDKQRRIANSALRFLKTQADRSDLLNEEGDEDSEDDGAS